MYIFSIGTDLTSNVIEVCRKTLFMLFKESTSRTLEDKVAFMEHKLREMVKCPQHEYHTLSHDIKYFNSDLKKRWISSNYIEERFLKKNEKWLSTSIPVHNWAKNSTGRPRKHFQELHDRSKRRKTKELREQVPVEELTYAASVSQRMSGNAAASKLIIDATSTPTRAKRYRKVINTAQKPRVNRYTPEQALQIFIDGDFTRRQWELLHDSNKGVFPCYTLIREAKKLCYPKPESIRVTETSVEVVLQDLLDHTIKRLCLYLEDVLQSCDAVELKSLELITKWGCDGSHQIPYQQKFLDSSNDDSNIFQSSLVPLRLQSHIGDRLKILWQNPTPSSTRFCRPIRIRFLKEDVDITQQEIKYVEDQANHLMKTEIERSNGIIIVRHVLLPTMVDAKVCNAATGTSSTRKCYICGKTSKNFNDFESRNSEDPQSLRFGLSILHARIRFFETILHLAYKLPIKKWQARSAEEKEIVKKTKEEIQKAYRERTGLLIDMPKPGFGNTNSGNTSRRFFADPELACQITGISKEFILKLKVILEAISSGHKINLEKFEEYCKNTASLYVDLYGWHPMTPTLHKILMHGASVIKYAILPIGQLSEEAAEARNRHFRSYREHFSRKFSRLYCNQDILNRLLLTSDPFISSTRKRIYSKSQPFLSETLELFEPEELNVLTAEEEILGIHQSDESE